MKIHFLPNVAKIPNTEQSSFKSPYDHPKNDISGANEVYGRNFLRHTTFALNESKYPKVSLWGVFHFLILNNILPVPK